MLTRIFYISEIPEWVTDIDVRIILGVAGEQPTPGRHRHARAEGCGSGAHARDLIRRLMVIAPRAGVLLAETQAPTQRSRRALMIDASARAARQPSSRRRRMGVVCRART